MREETHEGEELFIIEPSINAAVFVTGVANAHVANGLLSVVYFVEQPAVGTGIERVANLRLVMPLDTLRESRRAVDGAIAKQQRGMDS